MRDKWILVGAMLATVLVYWAGLSGPFILDDAWNLKPVHAWTDGEASWQQVVLDNNSGTLGRPVSMASFLLSGWLGGHAPFAFKLGNLLAHLLCGVLAFGLLRSVLRRDPHLAPQAGTFAAVFAGIWLLHPFNASTVLYAVQRMAQLSALFVLAAVWAYVVARNHLEAGRLRKAVIGLFVVVPALVLAGLLSKENAAVAPLMMLVLEAAYFRGRSAAQSKPTRNLIAAFYGLFLALPLVVGLFTRLRWDRLSGSYSARDFTLGERLLTQARVLMEYMGQILLPRGPRMGVIHDDYVVSTGLLSPPSTLFALLALLAISVGAVWLRKRAPAVFAGWFLFLAAHSIESTVFPLELYFEHRNYLPAIGLWLAVAGLAELATRGLREASVPRKRLGAFVAGALLLALSAATFARSMVWQSEDHLYAQALEQRPTSLRAITVNFEYGLKTGNRARIEDALMRYHANPNSLHRQLGHLASIRYKCLAGVGADPVDVQQSSALAQRKVSVLTTLSIEAIVDLPPEAECGSVTPLMLADMVEKIADASTGLSANADRKWPLRVYAARLYARGGRWDLALEQARLGWQPRADAPAGAFLVRALVQNGQVDEARSRLQEVRVRVDPRNLQYMKGLEDLEQFIEQRAAAFEPAIADPALKLEHK